MKYALLLVVLAACGPNFTAQSAPPPGRMARLDEVKSHYELDISAGVAIAISCYDSGPCKNVVVSTEDASIADVKGAAFGQLQKNEWNRNATWTDAGIVIIGKAPGKTKVKVKTKDGDKTFIVNVVAPPLVGAPNTAVARP
jgi:hypothetical protein